MEKQNIFILSIFLLGLIFLQNVSAYAFMNYGHNALWNETAECASGLCATWTGTPPTVETTQKFNGTSGIQIPNAFSYSDTGYSSTNFNFTYFIYSPSGSLGTGTSYLGLRDDVVQGCSGDGKGFSFGYASGTSTTQWSYCTAGTWTASGIVVTSGWHQIDINKQGTNYQFYFDGVNLKNGTDSKLGSFITGYSSIGGIYFDDLHAWNGTAQNISVQSNNNSITFLSQDPSDITFANLLTNHINITYNYTKNNISTPIYLNLTVIDSTRTCIITINGTCVTLNNSVVEHTYDQNGSSGNGTLYSFQIDENEIHPTSYNLHPETFANNTLSNFSLGSTSKYISTEIYNVSATTPYNIFEVNSISNINGGITRIYACNSTYNFSSNVASDTNCNNFGNINNNTFNHTDGNSSHNPITVPIVSGSIGTVKVTPTMYFIIRGATTGSIVQYIGQTTRTSTTKTTTNKGNAWSAQTFTIDAHLHQFNSGATGTLIKYNACANYTFNVPNGTVCSTFQQDNIDISYFAPSTPIIFLPTNATYQQYINISYAQSFPNANQTISNYTIQLLNNDQTNNKTLITNNNSTFSYYWNSYLDNLQIGTTYYIKVTVTDSVGLSSSDISEPFNFSTNGLLNVSIRSIFGNTSINGSITVFNDTNGISTTINTSTGYAYFDIIKGYAYLISTIPTNYANANTSTTPTTNFTQVYVYHFLTNTIYIDFYNESTDLLLSTSNVSIEFISDSFAQNYSTANGRFNVSLLSPDNYKIRYWIDASVPRDYYFTITPQSFNNLTLFVVDPQISNIYIPNVIDQAIRPVGNATIYLLRYYVGCNCYKTVEMTRTDSNGNGVLRVVPNIIPYKMIIVKDGASVTTQPTKFTDSTNSYTINLLSNPLITFNSLPSIARSLTFNNNTLTYTYTWNDQANIVIQGCLKIEKYTKTNISTLSNQCSAGSTGSIIYTISDTNNTKYVATAHLETNTEFSRIYDALTTDYSLTGVAIFGLVGMLIGLLLVLGFSMMSVDSGTDSVVITSVILLLALGGIGIITTSWTVLIPIIILAVIVIYKMRS